MNVSNAYINLVIMNIEGKHIPIDVPKALRFLNITFVQKNIMAQLLLSLIYSSIEYDKLDIKKAEYYLSKVEKGMNSFNQYFRNVFLQDFPNEYLQYFSKTFNFPKILLDYQNALKLLLGCTYENIGNIYQNGITVEKDIYQAIRMYKLSAQYNTSSAYRNLGSIFLFGDGVERNINEGISYLKISADLNDRISQLYLGCLYYFGTFIKKNIDEAIFYFTKSANNHQKIAQFYLGMIYYQGVDVKKDIDKAIYYLTESSNLNNSCSKNNLSIILKNGEGTRKDINRAIELLKETIDHDNNEVARYNLVHIYFYNDNNTQDLDKMIDYLINAQINLIDIYIIFLCLIIIKKIQPFTYDNLKEKIIKLNHKIDKLIVSKICDKIISNDLNNHLHYQHWYNFFRDVDLMYLQIEGNVTSWNLLQKKSSHVKDINDKKEIINHHFYEGFGIFD